MPSLPKVLEGIAQHHILRSSSFGVVVFVERVPGLQEWPCGVVVACLLHMQEVPGSIPGRGSYLRQVSLH